jgi:hypothetical protein
MLKSKKIRAYLKKLTVVQNNYDFFTQTLHIYYQARKALIEQIEKYTTITFYNKKFHWYPPSTILSEYDVITVIAFQERHHVLSIVVNEIFKAQTYNLNIGLVLACSSEDDLAFSKKLQSQHTHIGVVFCDNNPLGNKWQIAVNCARNFNTKTLMITGSDDLVTADYISNTHRHVCNYRNNCYVMAGVNYWYMLAYKKNTAFLKMALWGTRYKNMMSMPLGAGRIYNTTFLDSIDWQIFDRNLDSTLDDKGYNITISSNKKIFYVTPDNGFVVSIKGNWDAINSLNTILHKAPNILLNEIKEEKRKILLGKIDDSIKLLK